MASQTVFNIDENAATCYFSHIFPVEVPVLWDYFSKDELLVQWFAPAPWKAESISQNFAENGQWHYAMNGPRGERNYSVITYNEITPNRSIAQNDAFTDADGNILPNRPAFDWLLGFTGVQEGTKLTVNFHFKSVEEMAQILKSGFREGFLTGIQQLQALLTK